MEPLTTKLLTNKWNITVPIILHMGGIEFSADFSIAKFSKIDAAGRVGLGAPQHGLRNFSKYAS